MNIKINQIMKKNLRLVSDLIDYELKNYTKIRDTEDHYTSDKVNNTLINHNHAYQLDGYEKEFIAQGWRHLDVLIYIGQVNFI